MDAVTLEILKNALNSVSREMGVTLKRCGFSPNIKERNDFSCALFNEKGEMISQAEHLPIHLGSMPFSVAQAIKDFEEFEMGDVIILNDPYRGGTHLPDITLISPLFFSKKLVGFAANRAHHSDVGGKAPGSMAGDSTDIFQEGLRIPPTKLLEKGRENSELLNLILSNTRTPKEREGDLKAQIASNKVGERRFYELCEKYSLKILKEAMCELMDYSERRIRRELSKIPDGVYSFRDFMESDGIEERKFKIEIEITAKGGDLSFDFSKTSPQAKGPINAVFPVTASCVYYVTRCITDPEIPPNAGHYRPLAIIAPKGSLLNPIFPAPVAGGNVETSQRIVDVLLGALSEAIPDRVIAACCGSMNNVSIGGVDPERGTYAYYETIGGGFGARPGRDGIDGVHTHMTNTQNTPIEALESNLPIRIRRYEIRRNSGGEGKFRGGCGIVRELMLLRGEARLSLLAERHITKPYGLFGGGEGKRGKAYILSKGKKRKLKSKGTYDLKKDEILVIKTAGGGGYGLP